jgi:hypothetical protein
MPYLSSSSEFASNLKSTANGFVLLLNWPGFGVIVLAFCDDSPTYEREDVFCGLEIIVALAAYCQDKSFVFVVDAKRNTGAWNAPYAAVCDHRDVPAAPCKNMVWRNVT